MTMIVLIDNGHGEDTPGKRSPDGKFREYQYAREIADLLSKELENNGIKNEIIVKEKKDISLKERCRRVNNIFEKDNDCILISIHVNAAGNGEKWLNATGWQAHTSKGNTKSDILSEFLYNSAKKNLKGKKIRRDLRDGDSDFENNFYILKYTKCPAVLTENFFQDSKKDIEFLESEEGKKSIVKTHSEGIINYINHLK